MLYGYGVFRNVWLYRFWVQGRTWVSLAFIPGLTSGLKLLLRIRGKVLQDSGVEVCVLGLRSCDRHCLTRQDKEGMTPNLT